MRCSRSMRTTSTLALAIREIQVIKWWERGRVISPLFSFVAKKEKAGPSASLGVTLRGGGVRTEATGCAGGFRGFN
jgi:hypothetical protein